MYPFNRCKDFHAICYSDNHENENAHIRNVAENEALQKQQNPSTEDGTFMANVIKYSIPDQRWKKRFVSVTEEKSLGYMGLSKNLRTLTNELKPALIILRLMGYFYGFAYSDNRIKIKTRMIQLFLILFPLSVISFNLYIYRHNIIISLLYNNKFGFLHGATVSHLISGIKPLINSVLVTIFVWRFRKHQKMLRVMDNCDLCFRSTFHKSPNILIYMVIFTVAFILTLIIPLLWRIFELDLLQLSMKNEIFSLFIVPVLTAWNFLPLMYYVLCNKIVIFWCKILRKSLKKEHLKRHFSLKFYYEQFLRITALQEAIGHTFNPFIMFSLAWSLILLCLTIYFITQPTSSLTEPITHEQLHNETLRKILNYRLLVNMGWSLIQIIAAVLHIVVICATGMTTNEETRKILSAVLTIVPDANADLDRFQINCFAHKMSTQYMWGMTVWRAFPLERTTFFTLVSVIITYSLLLLKLKENPHISPRCPVLLNATI